MLYAIEARCRYRSSPQPSLLHDNLPLVAVRDRRFVGARSFAIPPQSRIAADRTFLRPFHKERRLLRGIPALGPVGLTAKESIACGCRLSSRHLFPEGQGDPSGRSK